MAIGDFSWRLSIAKTWTKRKKHLEQQGWTDFKVEHSQERKLNVNRWLNIFALQIKNLDFVLFLHSWMITLVCRKKYHNRSKIGPHLFHPGNLEERKLLEQQPRWHNDSPGVFVRADVNINGKSFVVSQTKGLYVCAHDNNYTTKNKKTCFR